MLFPPNGKPQAEQDSQQPGKSSSQVPTSIVNVITSNSGPSFPSNHGTVLIDKSRNKALEIGESSKCDVCIPIKVLTVGKMQVSKTYMLNINISEVRGLKCLCEEILDQLGKGVVKFDLTFNVGYISGNRKKFFTKNGDIKSELQQKIMV